MTTPLPPELKPVKKFIDRANEFQASGDHVVSYYCVRHAVEEALKTNGKSQDPNVRSALGDLLTKLETEKSNLKGIKEISDQDVGKAHFERITLNLFDEADVEDRSGLSTKATVKKFLVAGNLLEAMATFGPLSESIDEKRLYCKSKMVEMLKALKAGLPLSTGPPADGQSIDLTQPDHMQVDAPSINTKQTRQDEFGLPGPPPPEDDTPMNTHPGSLPPPPNTNDRATSPSSGLPQIPNHIPPSVKPGPSVTRSSKPKGFAGPPGTAKDVEDVSAEDMKRVNKLCRFCMSALMYDDVETAVSNLQEALALLTE